MAKTKGMHTLAELQGILSDQIDRIASDETTPAKVNAVVNATATILRTVKMQMDYAKQTGKTPNIPLLLSAGEEDAA
jgi:DNA-binding phage protein